MSKILYNIICFATFSFHDTRHSQVAQAIKWENKGRLVGRIGVRIVLRKFQYKWQYDEQRSSQYA
jgi:hypothetical protein